MFRPDSLTIGAYVDGELDAETALEVEAAAARDPEIRSELNELLKIGALVRVAFDEPVHEAVPERLIASIMEHEIGPAPRATGAEPKTDSKVVPLPSRRWSQAPGGVWAAAAALAALLIGFGGAQLLEDYREPVGLSGFSAASQSVVRQTVNEALETLPNGQPAPIAINSEHVGSVTPLRTYINGEGRYCRDYLVSLGIETGTASACRTDSGVWKEPLGKRNAIGRT